MLYLMTMTFSGGTGRPALSRSRGRGFPLVFLLWLLPLFCLPGRAGKFDNARRVARQVLGGFSRTADLSLYGVDSTASWVVLAPSGGAGFAVVSSDDSGSTLLGWSAAASWLRDCTVLRDGLERAAQLPPSRNTSARPQGTGVLLDTPLWNQAAPYNADVPLDGDSRSQAGCVPTALAVIMAWHGWPPCGTGTTSAYVTATAGLDVPSRDLTAPYDWHLMRHSYSSGWSVAEGAAVARLMADIGAALRADYTAVSTSAYASPSVLVSMFGYHPGLRWVYRHDFDVDGWFRLLASEVDADRPVLYTVHYPAGGGHAVVVDGYDTSGFVHVNWGWGGRCNGYYLPDVLYPSAGGADGFSYRALVGFKPDDGSPVSSRLVLEGTPGFSAAPVPFHEQKLMAALYNPCQLPFEGTVRPALVGADGSYRWAGDAVAVSLSASMAARHSFSFRLPEDAAGGCLRLMYCLAGETGWQPVSTLTGYGSADIVLPAHYPLSMRCRVSASRTARSVSLVFPSGTQAVLTRGGAVLDSGFVVTDGVLVAGAGLFRGGGVQVTLSLGQETCSFLLHVSSSTF